MRWLLLAFFSLFASLTQPVRVVTVLDDPPPVTTSTTTAPRRPSAATTTTAAARTSRGAVRPRSAYQDTENRCGGWRDLVSRYGWPVDEACAVLMCESRGDPHARNRRSTATGLFQILGGPTDPEANVAQAFAMWSRRGWQPWSACR